LRASERTDAEPAESLPDADRAMTATAPAAAIAPATPLGIRAFVRLTIGWILIGVFNASHEWTLAAASGRPLPLAGLMAPHLTTSIIWAILTLVIFTAVYRIRFERLETWHTLLTLFVPMLIAVAVVAVFGEYLAYQIAPATRGDFSSRFLVQELHPALLEGFIVLGIACTMRLRQNASERALLSERLLRELSEARTHMLRSQMQPHFLFNALHSIAALISSAPETAETMVARLAALLRMSMSLSAEQIVPLATEIAFAERYLQIQSARFAERLSVTWRVAPELLDLAVPSFVIQPLLENCFKHGASRSDGRCAIEISAAVAGGRLTLEVTDRYEAPTRGAVPPGDGVGIGNLRARLQGIYGDAARMQLALFPGGGSRTVVELPATAAGTVSPR
jgi:two-component system LytT family sensor kinase